MGKHIPRKEHPRHAQAHTGSAMQSTPPTKDKKEHQGEGLARGSPAASPPGETRELSHNEIAIRAYEIWLAKGRPDGTDRDDWLAAEQQVRSRRANPQSDTTPLDSLPEGR